MIFFLLQVIFLEDDDVAAVINGDLTIHRIKRDLNDPNESTVREVITLKMEIQEIMKGGDCFFSFLVFFSFVIFYFCALVDKKQ